MAFSLSRTGDPRSSNRSFRITPSQLDAISHNVRTTQKGVARNPSKDSLTVAAMQRLADRLSRSGRADVRQAGERTKELFGSALGADIDKGLQLAYTTARATDKDTHALAKAGAQTQHAGEVGVSAIQAGSAAAQRGAAYELQQALKELSASGGSDAAQAKVDFYTMMLQHRWDQQAARQDQQNNMAYLRAQMRLSNGGASSGAYSSAAADLQDFLGQTTSVKAPDGTETTVPVNSDPQQQANYVQSLVGQYNLGPQEAEQLRTVLYARTGASTGLDAADVEHIQQAADFVSNQAKSGQVGALTDQNILDALGIAPQANGTVIVNGTTFPVEWAIQALAQFKQAYSGPLATESS